MSDMIWNGSYTLGNSQETQITAGTGIKVTTPAAGQIQVAADETVLWEGTGWAVGDTGQSLTLSESPLNFGTIRVYGYRPLNSGSTTYPGVFSADFDMQFLNAKSATNIMIPYSIMSGGTCYVGGMGISGVTTSSWTESGGFHYPIGGSKSNGEYAHVHKVVGINRISGGN